MTIESMHEILNEITDMLTQTAENAKQQYDLSEEGSLDRICYKVINNAVCEAATVILNKELEFNSEMMMACLKVLHKNQNEEES